MNTRLRFKLIAILITLSLAGLVAFQGYWLHGLYKTLYGQMEINIQEAMKNADYKEMFLRIKELKNKDVLVQHKSETISIYSDDKSNSPADSTRKRPYAVMSAQDGYKMQEHSANMQVQIDYSEENDSTPVDSTLTDYLTTIGQIENMIQRAMHMDIDSLSPIVFDNYNKFLKQELIARNIVTEHELIVAYQPEGESKAKGWMNLGSNEILKKAYKDKLPSDTTVNVPLVSDKDFSRWKDVVYFDYPIFTDNLLYYRLYLKSPSYIILKQMSGILVSSVILFILIVIAFIYLLRTILRQKTMEELKTDFTNNMTHELKTPISVSYAAVDALLNFSDSVSDKQRKYLTVVKDQLTHLTGLVEQILALAVENRSTFHLHPEEINISRLVTSLAEQYRLKAGKEVEFKLNVSDNLDVQADRTHIYNMLSNLVDNAIKYCDKEPCCIILEATKNEQEVCISVIDNGRGISETNQKHIFDKFFRVPNGNLHNTKGYGLGLYYVRDMMAKHGGTVTVESHLGKGSTFTLHFKYT
ncbi:sensor histidine kinase [Parabacteroides bouchesdurhonensis]|uniref:sensor histidine kinase n=1 Tax=Parabacteroides bouchesdurhonensis TaxID=1936995 RepID=UPI000E4BC77A|nr:HAMP domain-containing sensor histidine kinase [Parabacteroides bouchesdurhonensis]RHJ91361.1 sensor histidine kinase [Bacteroides sp. AM07-16]